MDTQTAQLFEKVTAVRQALKSATSEQALALVAQLGDEAYTIIEKARIEKRRDAEAALIGRAFKEKNSEIERWALVIGYYGERETLTEYLAAYIFEIELRTGDLRIEQRGVFFPDESDTDGQRWTEITPKEFQDAWGAFLLGLLREPAILVKKVALPK